MDKAVDPNAKEQHLLLIRGLDWDKGLSASELQEVLTHFYDWVKSLETDGVLAGAQPLAPSGKVLTGSGGASIADGPFAETKEAVGGYFLLNVAGIDRAIELAQQCPALEYGAILEVRPVLQQCPMLDKLGPDHGVMLSARA